MSRHNFLFQLEIRQRKKKSPLISHFNGTKMLNRNLELTCTVLVFNTQCMHETPLRRQVISDDTLTPFVTLCEWQTQHERNQIPSFDRPR